MYLGWYSLYSQYRYRSVAPTASCHHVIVLLQHHVFVIVEVQQIDGEEFVGHAARRLDAFGKFERVDDGLDGGVVRRSHVLAQRKGTGAFAVVSVITARRHDPSGPADLLEVYVEWQALAWRSFSVVFVVEGSCGTTLGGR